MAMPSFTFRNDGKRAHGAITVAQKTGFIGIHMTMQRARFAHPHHGPTGRKPKKQIMALAFY